MHDRAIKGVPAAIIIDGGIPVVRGSDYEDHFKLSVDARPEDIMAVITTIPNRQYPEEAARFVSTILESIADSSVEAA